MAHSRADWPSMKSSQSNPTSDMVNNLPTSEPGVFTSCGRSASFTSLCANW